MSGSVAFEVEAQRVLQAHIVKLQRLSYADVSALPEAAGTEIAVSGHRCQLTVFVQPVSSGVLVVAQLARSELADLSGSHQELGLVFAPTGSVRDASEHELLTTGG